MPKKLSDAPTGTQFKDGAWYARYTYKGDTIYEKCDNKTQARILYGKRKAEIREGKYFPKVKETPKPKFSELAKIYKTYSKHRCKRPNDNDHSIKLWESIFGPKVAEEITISEVEDTIRKWQDEGLKPATIHRRLVVMKAILNKAVKERRIKDNPVSEVKPPQYDNTIVRSLDAREEVLLFQAIPERIKPIVIVALNSGCRQGELLKLTWADVRIKEKLFICRDTKANRKDRWVLMNSSVLLIFKELSSKEHHPKDRVFNIDGSKLRKLFSQAVKESGIAHFRFHDIRHTFASRLTQAGYNTITVQTAGGWKSPAMLKRYAHLEPGYLREALESLTKPTLRIVDDVTAQESVG